MNRAKYFRYLFITYILLVLSSGVIFCQDLIYKKDGSVTKVRIESFDGKTIIYRMPFENSSFSYFLSYLLVDSLRYSDGRKFYLSHFNEVKTAKTKTIPRNYLDAEIISLFSGNPYITYERLTLNGKAGFLAGLFINAGSKSDYWDLRRGWGEYLNYEPCIFFTKFGFSLYPYNKSLSRVGLFRFSTGLSIHAGLYRAIDWTYYYQNGFRIKEERLDAFSLMSNTKCRLYLGNNFQIYTGLDFSVYPCMTFFCPQIGISAGF
jgi:hypothetical protein